MRERQETRSAIKAPPLCALAGLGRAATDMLARSVGRLSRLRLGAAAPAARRLCSEAVATEGTAQEKVAAQLADMKARLEKDPPMYDKAKLQADLEAGTVDRDLLAESFKFSDDFHKARRSEIIAQR